jgi:hypothetical protein
MIWFLLAVITAQVVLFHLDEYYFHRKRRLTRGEIVSALIDGILYVIPLTVAIFAPFSDIWKAVFIGMSVISCLSIAKNEFFYPKLERRERMVHSFLYVLHPVVLYTYYISWQGNYFSNYMNFWILQIIYLGLGVRTLAHQVIYWNYIYSDELHEG